VRAATATKKWLAIRRALAPSEWTDDRGPARGGKPRDATERRIAFRGCPVLLAAGERHSHVADSNTWQAWSTATTRLGPGSQSVRRWLARHPRFHLHFTPTYASWINLVERWFAWINEKRIRRGTHESTKSLVSAIRNYVDGWNDDPRAFVWTKTANDILAALGRFCSRISDFAARCVRSGRARAADRHGGAAYAATMPLTPFEIEPVVAPLPAAASAFLTAARQRIDAWFARPEHRAGFGFVPSDYELVWRTLAALRRDHPDAHRLLEWGSGFGVVVGLAASLGFEASGIEIDRGLAAVSRELLAAHRLRATIAAGSFVPDDDVAGERLADLETRTVLGAADAYDELEADLDDFDVVFAYPWTTEEALYCELFARGADHGAVLLTYSRTEGVRAYRKVGRRARR
jgi:hypothetical protein